MENNILQLKQENHRLKTIISQYKQVARLTNWLDDVNIYRYNFGEAQNRKELDVKDKFLKVRIRYSGEELAIIDFLNTVYRISYS